MRKRVHRILRKAECVLRNTTWIVGGISLACLIAGYWFDAVTIFGLGAAGLCYAALRLGGWGPPERFRQKAAQAPKLPGITPPRKKRGMPSDTEDLVELMLAQGRYALLLRPEVVLNLTEAQYERALVALEEEMALIPQGEVAIARWVDLVDGEDREEVAARSSVVKVEPFFLDRYPITNRQYYEFVAAGGYEEMAIWHQKIWPGVLDFVDQSGEPGPRFWQHGCYPSGEDDFPVVGVSWYEAAAYARWAGKRLPTDPEWEKAGSWPVEMSATLRPQRRFPWGDSMDRTRCHVWGSGPSRTVSVYALPEGVSVGGVHQLVGNVWEWTSGNLSAAQLGREWLLPTPLKSIRGGAFDTYFENQATCQFQSGEDPIARKHNIGFRCALSACDLAEFVAEPAADEAPEAEAEHDATEVTAGAEVPRRQSPAVTTELVELPRPTSENKPQPASLAVLAEEGVRA